MYQNQTKTHLIALHLNPKRRSYEEHCSVSLVSLLLRLPRAYTANHSAFLSFTSCNGTIKNCLCSLKMH